MSDWPNPVEVTVGSLVEALAESSRGRPFVLDEKGLQAAHDQLVRATGSPTLLYSARRDAVPPVVVDAETAPTTWRLDRVEFAGGLIPGSKEISRSIGHWNPADQWEVFEVVAGEVLMVVQTAETDTPIVVACSEGAVLSLSPGAWHLTYSPGGPAVVENIYCRTGPGSAAASGPPADKYSTRAPLEHGLWQEGPEVRVFTRDSTESGRRPHPYDPLTVEGGAYRGLLREVMAGQHPPALREPDEFWSTYLPPSRQESAPR